MNYYELILHYTGLVFWIFCATVGALYLFDRIFWNLMGIIIKKYNLEKDLSVFLKDRWENRNKNYPA